MGAADRNDTIAEIAAILAAGYLRLLQAKSANQQGQAKLRAQDSVESPCNGSPRET